MAWISKGQVLSLDFNSESKSCVLVVYPRWLERSSQEEKRSRIQTLPEKSSSKDGLQFRRMNEEKWVFQVIGHLKNLGTDKVPHEAVCLTSHWTEQYSFLSTCIIDLLSLNNGVAPHNISSMSGCDYQKVRHALAAAMLFLGRKFGLLCFCSNLAVSLSRLHSPKASIVTLSLSPFTEWEAS